MTLCPIADRKKGMGYRCANDLFNYCSDKPEWGKPPKALGVGRYPGGGSCKLDPRTCRKNQTTREQVGDRLTELKPAEGIHKPKKTKRRK